MATRRKIRARESQLAFEALSIEGGVLSPAWLARVAQLDAGAQSEADYHIPRGLNVRDEIGRYWRIAQQYWRDFNLGAGTAADPARRARDFVLGMLREAFGFSSLAEAAPIERGGRTYPIGHAALGGRVPVVIAPAGSGLDTAAPAFGEAGRRRSAFGVAQEFLNAADDALWGIATDGHTLRILRDNSSLTRPAWIEVDLARIFAEERYADFAAFWLMAHESRFGRPDHAVTDCALEAWRAAGREEGTRARAHLRLGVEQALLAFGNGFLSHPDNQDLRAALTSGRLKKEAYFQQLLRLVYRLIFLLTVEERGVLHPADASGDERALYADGYSLRRLREQAVRRSAHDRFGDLWEGVKVVFRGVASSEPRLGLPALAGIFATHQCPDLDRARLENRHLLAALFRLSWLREDTGLSRVNWRDMGPEELGSVYEGLLELVPQITQDGRAFAFASGGETKGNARKLTGSYYTPDSLVQVLLDSALEPVVKETIAAHSEDPVAALLKLSVVDPACGSGHFLLAAARRLAGYVARLRSSGTPSAAEYRHALREVVGNCIFGVDLNPMAVELCKVSLWMEAVEPGRPLSFLDSHIQHGNSLLGSTPELMAKGIPDAAWEPIEGDDKKVASALKKRNKQAAAGQRGLDTLWSEAPESESEKVARAVAALDAASDADREALAKKEQTWAALLESGEYRHQKFVADAWCAAFVWPKQPGPLADAAPTNELWRQLRDGQGQPAALTVKTVENTAQQYGFFHWRLAFPQVFARGGFDVVLGNPPWERVKLQEQEFFASRSEEIARAKIAAGRKKLIAKLPTENPTLWREWCESSREAEGESHFVRRSNRYPFCGQGDINTYQLFAEHNRSALSSRARAGFIVPSGLITDDTTKDFFRSLVESRQLASVYHFENEAKLFPGVHHAFRFVLVTIDGARQSGAADLACFMRGSDELRDASRHFALSFEEFEVLNPNTGTCPTFRSRQDANLNLRMYSNAGVFVRDGDNGEVNPWKLEVRTRTWHMAEDSQYFRSAEDLAADGYRAAGTWFLGEETFVPLIEAKMLHFFDHRFGTYDGQTAAQENQGKLPELSDADHADPSHLSSPYYWVSKREVEARLADVWTRGWLLAWRDITGTEKQRTLIPTVVPRVGVGHSAPLMFPGGDPQLVAALYGNLCSHVLDYAARQKVGGVHLSYGLLKQLPVLPPSRYALDVAWQHGTLLRDWLLVRVLELTYTAWDLGGFAEDVGYHGPPFVWNPDRRFLLRAELDAAFFHLYGISHDDAAYILDTFPIVRKNDEKTHSEYRTKRVILEIYDAMEDAARTGHPYQTRLNPPPADPCVAHPPRTGAAA